MVRGVICFWSLRFPCLRFFIYIKNSGWGDNSSILLQHNRVVLTTDACIPLPIFVLGVIVVIQGVPEGGQEKKR